MAIRKARVPPRVILAAFQDVMLNLVDELLSFLIFSIDWQEVLSSVDL